MSAAPRSLTMRGPRRPVTAGRARKFLALVGVGAALAAVVTAATGTGFESTEKVALPGAAAAVDRTFGNAAAGDCLQWTPTDDPNTDRQDLATVPCAQPHRFEVADNVDLAVYPGAEFAPSAPYPDAARFASLRDEHCVAAVDEYMRGRFDPSGRYEVGLMYPSRAGWTAGERTIRCGLQQTSATRALETMVGSVADQDQSVVWDTGTCVGIADRAPTNPVDCSQPHAFEVVSVVDLSAQFPGGLPTVEDQDRFLEQTCNAAATAYLGDPNALRNKTLTLFWDNVDATGWLAGSRKVSCAIGKEVDPTGFATIVGSAKGDITIDGAVPVAPPPISDGRAAPVPLPGAAPVPAGGN